MPSLPTITFFLLYLLGLTNGAAVTFNSTGLAVSAQNLSKSISGQSFIWPIPGGIDLLICLYGSNVPRADETLVLSQVVADAKKHQQEQYRSNVYEASGSPSNLVFELVRDRPLSYSWIGNVARGIGQFYKTQPDIRSISFQGHGKGGKDYFAIFGFFGYNADFNNGYLVDDRHRLLCQGSPVYKNLVALPPSASVATA